MISIHFADQKLFSHKVWGNRNKHFVLEITKVATDSHIPRNAMNDFERIHDKSNKLDWIFNFSFSDLDWYQL